MSSASHLKYEFAQSGWRQSIAVNIAAQIIWMIIPIVFISALLLFNSIEKDQSKIFSSNVDALNHRVSNIVVHSPQLSKEEKDQIIKKIAAELDFKAIEVTAPNYQLAAENSTKHHAATISTLSVDDEHNSIDNAFLIIKAFHVPLEQLISQKRKDILAVILLCLATFAVFLVFSIRTWLYKPLKTLVDATESVAAGNADVILDTDRRDEFGHLSAFFSRMIANLAQQHNSLREAAKVASDANEAKSRFLANMSHELRTPLNAIIGYNEMLLDDARDKNHLDYVEDLEKSIYAGKHLLHLINEVLDLSKIEAGKMEMYISMINIEKLTADIRLTIDPLVSQRNNVLVIETDPDVRAFYSDLTKVRQVLINLLGNACKFTENGKITLKVSKLNIDTKECIEFKVIDSGIGIREENLNLLFNPFTQEDNSSTRSYSGTGLGLSISQRLCHLMGGNISVESVKGKGSSFTVTLPVNHKEAGLIPFTQGESRKTIAGS